ncbi:HIRAN domain-containing protein [Treponema sp. R80B11-R83G3]
MKNSEMKSKVVTLANRLTSRMGGDKSAAFVKAWAIVKAGKLELAVKGTSFGNRQEALKRLAAYKPDQIKAVLVPEPENPADHNAVAVLVGVKGGKGLYRLGYVPRDMAAVVTAMGVKVPALRVVCGTWGWASKTTFGARVALTV